MADTIPTITFYRGDVYPKQITLTDKKTGQPIDLTGMILTLTVNTEKEPLTTDNQLFQITGVLEDAVKGVVLFTPSVGDNDLLKAKYYFDVSAVAGATFKKTMLKGVWEILQDINKD